MANYPGNQIILASGSSSRRTLLENAGLEFSTQPAEVDERAIEARLSSMSPSALATELAQAKAVDVSAKRPGAVVIGADQTLSLDDRVFHKAKDLRQAKTHLLLLAGRTHQLNSAAAVAVDGNILWSDLSISNMEMRALTEKAVENYIARAGEKILASVGCYQLEGEGIRLFNCIQGDYFSILGLQLLPLLAGLRLLGALDE